MQFQGEKRHWLKGSVGLTPERGRRGRGTEVGLEALSPVSLHSCPGLACTSLPPPLRRATWWLWL